VEPRGARPGARPRTLYRGADPGGGGAGTGHGPPSGAAGPADVGEAPLASGQPDVRLSTRRRCGAGHGLAAAAALLRRHVRRDLPGGLRRPRASPHRRHSDDAGLADPGDPHSRPRCAGAGGAAAGGLPRRDQSARHRRLARRGHHRRLLRTERGGTRLRLLKGPALPGLLRLRQTAGAHHGAGLRHDIMPAGVHVGRGAPAASFGRDRSDRPRPGPQTDGPADAALALPVL